MLNCTIVYSSYLLCAFSNHRHDSLGRKVCVPWPRWLRIVLQYWCWCCVWCSSVSTVHLILCRLCLDAALWVLFSQLFVVWVLFSQFYLVWVLCTLFSVDFILMHHCAYTVWSIICRVCIGAVSIVQSILCRLCLDAAIWVLFAHFSVELSMTQQCE